MQSDTATLTAMEAESADFINEYADLADAIRANGEAAIADMLIGDQDPKQFMADILEMFPAEDTL